MTPADFLPRVEVKQLSDSKLIMKGSTSTWYVDLDFDRFAKGAFAESIQWDQGRFPILWRHHYTLRLGETTKAIEDDEGLFVEATLVLRAGLEPLFDAIRSGLVKAMSVRFQPLDSHKEFHRERTVRVITRANLVEASVCPMGVNQNARIVDVVDPAAVVAEAQDYLRRAEAERRREVEQLFADCQATLARAGVQVTAGAPAARGVRPVAGVGSW